MVRREDNRPIGGAGIAPGLVPCPPLVLILGVFPLRVNQKTATDKCEKPNYPEFPESWAGELFGISEELGIGFRRIVTASRQIHNPPQCCLNPLIPADALRRRLHADFRPQFRRQADRIRLLRRPEIRFPAGPRPRPATRFALCAHSVLSSKKVRRLT
jgi:hypothetical protein